VRSPVMAVGSWLLVSTCGGYPDACSRFQAVVALSFMSLHMVPYMLMLGKDTPASMTFGRCLGLANAGFLLSLLSFSQSEDCGVLSGFIV
jgi:hypothetical protein